MSMLYEQQQQQQQQMAMPMLTLSIGGVSFCLTPTTPVASSPCTTNATTTTTTPSVRFFHPQQIDETVYCMALESFTGTLRIQVQTPIQASTAPAGSTTATVTTTTTSTSTVAASEKMQGEQEQQPQPQLQQQQQQNGALSLAISTATETAESTPMMAGATANVTPKTDTSAATAAAATSSSSSPRSQAKTKQDEEICKSSQKTTHASSSSPMAAAAVHPTTTTTIANATVMMTVNHGAESACLPTLFSGQEQQQPDHSLKRISLQPDETHDDDDDGSLFKRQKCSQFQVNNNNDDDHDVDDHEESDPHHHHHHHLHAAGGSLSPQSSTLLAQEELTQTQFSSQMEDEEEHNEEYSPNLLETPPPLPNDDNEPNDNNNNIIHHNNAGNNSAVEAATSSSSSSSPCLRTILENNHSRDSSTTSAFSSSSISRTSKATTTRNSSCILDEEQDDDSDKDEEKTEQANCTKMDQEQDENKNDIDVETEMGQEGEEDNEGLEEDAATMGLDSPQTAPSADSPQRSIVSRSPLQQQQQKQANLPLLALPLCSSQQETASPCARWGHTMTELGKGFLLVYGGQTLDATKTSPFGKTLNDVHVYNIRENKWYKECVNNGSMVVGGGSSSDQHDILGSLPRQWHTATFLSDRNLLICLGGEAANPKTGKTKTTDPVMVLDTEIMVWYPPVVSGDIPNGRSGHTTCLLVQQSERSTGTRKTEELVLFGGVRGNKWLNSVSVLNTQTWVWRTPRLQGMAPRPRSYHSATAISNRIVIFGGNNAEQSFNTVHVLERNVDNDDKTIMWRWTHPNVRGHPPKPRSGHSATLLADKKTICIYGGWDVLSDDDANDEDYIFQDSFLLDTENWEWKPGPVTVTSPFSTRSAKQHDCKAAASDTKRVGHASVLIVSEADNNNSQKVLIFGGRAPGDRFTCNFQSLDLDPSPVFHPER